MNKLLVLALLVACVVAAPENDDVQPVPPSCFESGRGILNCFFVKLITFVDKACKLNKIKIFEGAFLTRIKQSLRVSRSIERSESDIISMLPEDNLETAFILATMFYDSVIAFMDSHELKLNTTGESFIGRYLVEERNKIKEFFESLFTVVGYIIVALTPLLIGSLTTLVSKALLFGKFALFIIGIMGFQKLISTNNVATTGPTNVFNENTLYPWQYNHLPSRDPVVFQDSRYETVKDNNANHNHNMVYSSYVPPRISNGATN